MLPADGQPRSELQASYVRNVCLSLTGYADTGAELHFASDHQSDGALVITFTLLDGGRYHEILREQMNTLEAPSEPR